MLDLAKYKNYDWTLHTPRPLDPELNRAIIAVANVIFPAGFEVSDDAPDTYEKLKSRLDAGQCMLVWSGASDKTVFGCPEVNWAYRAWHDWCHWQAQLPFTLDGEERAARMQGEQLIALFGDTQQTRRWQRIIHADIVGQGLYAEEHGHFPSDQSAIVLQSLQDSMTLLAVAS
jgi:hypothetical protein